MNLKTSAAGMEYGRTFLDIKSMDEKTGMFSGYASRFGNEDLGGDIVRKGAFSVSLTERPARQVKMLREHNPERPIGFWTELYEDDNGLVASGQLLVNDLQDAREVHALMKCGQMDGLSIGYRVRKSSPDRSNRIRYLEDVELREISAVLFPMNELCAIEVVKSSQDDLPTEREFERLLMQDAGQLGLPRLTRSEIRQFILPGYKSLLKAKQDAGREVASTPPDVDWSLLTDGLRRLTDAAQS